MTFDTLKIESARYAPAFLIDRVIPYRIRHAIKTFSFILFVACSIPALFVIFSDTFLFTGEDAPRYLDMLRPYFLLYNQFAGASIAAFGLWLCFVLFDGFYFSILFSDEDSALREFPRPPAFGVITLDVADILLSSDVRDVTGSFLKTAPGKALMSRLGIKEETAEIFERTLERKIVPASALSFNDGERVTISSFARAVHAADPSFRTFLKSESVSDAEFLETARWLAAMAARIRKRRRWWARDFLGRTPALGTSFSYGRAYSLEKFGSYLTRTNTYRTNAPLLSYFRKEAEELETILVRAKGANAIIVGEDADAPLLVSVAAARLIERGDALPPLEHKQFFLLDPERITAAGGTKAHIESALITVLTDASRAGNLIVIVPNVGAFMKSLSNYNIDLFSTLESFLRSDSINLIVLSDADAYHRTFERDTQLMEHFERVVVEEKGGIALMNALERTAETIERREHVFYTHLALKKAAESAEQYFSETSPLDKATDLIIEAAVGKKGGVITADDIGRLIESKTGVPSGGPKGDERAKLLSLEALLRKRVIGQPDATAAVAAAMRRARSGIRSEKKPMGTFLFLGPTGVGKTETAKALAAAYFGSEDSMIRFDMSEFSGSDALHRLIGTQSGEPGLLVTKLRTRPFSVLLFDEFEKSSLAVRDLFLQLLDEGFITDAEGKKVYARSAFIIATSNAASDEIFRLTEEGRDLSKERNTIIEMIISKGLFRPELLNRFDGVILFTPMNEELTEAVARQLLGKFAKRIEDKGYRLILNDALVKYIAKEGADPKFGARPLNRAIAEKIEQAIADKIIEGSLKPGAKIEFMAEDLK